MTFPIFLAILGVAWCFGVSLLSLLRCFFIFLDGEETLSGITCLSVSISTVILGILILNMVKVERPETRDIHLTVPTDSSVNAQVTSNNNTVNITDI